VNFTRSAAMELAEHAPAIVTASRP
jgi:hypothetical protein